jgi:hypothetical protein
MDGEGWTACACGERFGSTEELTAHILAAFRRVRTRPWTGTTRGT